MTLAGKIVGVATALILSGFLIGCSDRTQPDQFVRRHLDQPTPEQEARSFWIAYLRQDAQGIKQWALPHPELHLLWERSVSFPPTELEGAVSSAETCALRQLKPGERFTFLDHEWIVEDYDRANYRPLLMDWYAESIMHAVRLRD